MIEMKKEELKGLIEEHLILSKRIKKLKGNLEKTEDRYKEVGHLLCGFRSKKFLRSVLSCLRERMDQYAMDEHFDSLLHMVMHSLQGLKDIDPKEFNTRKLLRLYEEEVD
jgi:hypothetical protein